MAYLETKDGTRLFYQDRGTGKPVVLIHGWCIQSDSWEYVSNVLPHHGLRVITYDQRGCGRSDHPWTGYDYDTLAADLAALLEKLDLRDVTLVGHSLACGVVTRYLARYGDARVARAALVATTTPYPMKDAPDPDQIMAQMTAAIRKDRPAYVMSLVPPFFGNDAPVSQPMIDWALDLTLQASPQAGIEMQRSCWMTDQTEELKRITVPTLIVHGDTDLSAPLEKTAQPTHDLIANSRLLIYTDNAAHGIYITHAQRLNQDLLAFIS